VMINKISAVVIAISIRSLQSFAIQTLDRRSKLLLGSRKNSKPEKYSKMPQNPTRQVHALLGAFCALINN
jgi:hypothetical protein